MPNWLTEIPEELAHYIHTIYFNTYVLTQIKTRGCYTDIYLGPNDTKKIKCGSQCHDGSIYCVNCMYHTVNYY